MFTIDATLLPVMSGQPTAVADLVRAVILGIIQGLTEFLPISSSGHLAIVPALLGYEKPQLAFDVLLHLGTLTAVIVYFRGDLWKFVLCLVAPTRLGPEETRQRRRLLVLLAIASVPAAVIGFLVQDWADRAGEQPLRAAWFIIGTTSLMIAAELADRYRRRARANAGTPVAVGVSAPSTPAGSDPAPANQSASADQDPAAAGERELGALPASRAVGIGFAQALALIPGVSRSGATISTGLLLGVSRATAARFSFLLSIPVILGAGVLKVGDLGNGTESLGELTAGFVAAAISGFLAVSVLMRVMRTSTLWPFIWYRLIAGTFFVVVLTQQGF